MAFGNAYGIDLGAIDQAKNALADQGQRRQVNALALQKGQMELDQAPAMNALALKGAQLGVDQKETAIAGEKQSQAFALHANQVKMTTDALGALDAVPDEQLPQATAAVRANLQSQSVPTAAIDQVIQQAGSDPAKLRPLLKQAAQQGLGYAAQLTQQNSDRTFSATQENTKAVRDATAAQREQTQANFEATRASTEAYRKATLGQGQERIDATKATKAGADDATVKSYGDNILNGNAMLQNVPQASRDAVSRYISEQTDATSPLGAQRSTTAASKITAPYTNLSQYKLAADAQPYLQRIDAASKTPGPVADQDMLDSLTKLNTGGNAVTDAQVKLITDGKSYRDALDTFGKKFTSGGTLSDSMRKQIVEISKAIAANYNKGYQPVYEAATKQLKDAGIKPQFWTIPDLNKFSGAGNASAPPPAGASPDDLVKHYLGGSK